MSRGKSEQGVPPFRATLKPPPQMRGVLTLVIGAEFTGSLGDHLVSYGSRELSEHLGAELANALTLGDRVPDLIYIPGPGTAVLRDIRRRYPVSAIVYFGDFSPTELAEAVNAGANAVLPIQQMTEHMVYLAAVEALQRAEVYQASVDVRGMDLVLTEAKAGSPEVIGLVTATSELLVQLDAALSAESVSAQDIAKLELLKSSVMTAMDQLRSGKGNLRELAAKQLRRLNSQQGMPSVQEAQAGVRSTLYALSGEDVPAAESR